MYTFIILTMRLCEQCNSWPKRTEWSEDLIHKQPNTRAAYQHVEQIVQLIFMLHINYCMKCTKRRNSPKTLWNTILLLLNRLCLDYTCPTVPCTIRAVTSQTCGPIILDGWCICSSGSATSDPAFTELLLSPLSVTVGLDPQHLTDALCEQLKRTLVDRRVHLRLLRESLAALRDLVSGCVIFFPILRHYHLSKFVSFMISKQHYLIPLMEEIYYYSMCILSICYICSTNQIWAWLSSITDVYILAFYYQCVYSCLLLTMCIFLPSITNVYILAFY